MKHTKGKQKIEMKEVEDYEDRMTTFSKRKAGILKKMNEMVTLCDAEASFLVFSQAGKPHTFTHPSMEDAVARVNSTLGHEPSSGENDTNTEPLVEAYMRQKDEELKKRNVDFTKELEMEEEKEKKLKESKSIKMLDEMWWNDEGLSVEEVKQRHQSFMELNVSLCGVPSSQYFEKDGDGGDEADACE
ncbi:hypothetical protein N665_1437s0001 [Sinapis alba]|nr:hypothetical protein N665_1437s0001 [Sinapis alba]